MVAIAELYDASLCLLHYHSTGGAPPAWCACENRLKGQRDQDDRSHFGRRRDDQGRVVDHYDDRAPPHEDGRASRQAQRSGGRRGRELEAASAGARVAAGLERPALSHITHKVPPHSSEPANGIGGGAGASSKEGGGSGGSGGGLSGATRQLLASLVTSDLELFLHGLFAFENDVAAATEQLARAAAASAAETVEAPESASDSRRDAATSRSSRALLLLGSLFKEPR